MADKVRSEAYWYEVQLLVRTKTKDKTVPRSGTLYAMSPLDALDLIYDKAKESWNGVVLHAKVCTVDENGEIVATTQASRIAHLDEKEDTKTSHSVTAMNVYDFASNFTGHKTYPILSLRRYEDDQSTV
jgi:hypothetical protein